MGETMNEDEMHALFMETLRKAGGVRALARLWGLSAAHVSDMARGNRRVSESVLTRLGLERVVSVTYRRVG